MYQREEGSMAADEPNRYPARCGVQPLTDEVHRTEESNTTKSQKITPRTLQKNCDRAGVNEKGGFFQLLEKTSGIGRMETESRFACHCYE